MTPLWLSFNASKSAQFQHSLDVCAQDTNGYRACFLFCGAQSLTAAKTTEGPRASGGHGLIRPGPGRPRGHVAQAAGHKWANAARVLSERADPDRLDRRLSRRQHVACNRIRPGPQSSRSSVVARTARLVSDATSQHCSNKTTTNATLLRSFAAKTQQPTQQT